MTTRLDSMDSKDQRLLNDLKRYGDRTSSLMTLYPGFQSFENTHPSDSKSDSVAGQIRYAETARSWIAATEPLTAQEKRAALFQTFETEAKRQGKRPIMVPVTEKLSTELVMLGCHRIQVGSEPIIELADYFKNDPLDLFPHARSLLKRGFRVEAIDPQQIDEPLRAQLAALTQSWIENRNTVPLQFLNQVNPWKFAELKKFFVVRSGEKIFAFLSAAPIAAKNSYFYADYIRDPQSRAGTVELLFIESMRLLHQQGVNEIHLGLCPFAQIDAKQAKTPKENFALLLMQTFFHRARFPLNFKSIYEFKSKFKPTRWEPLYLVTSTPIDLQTTRDLARVHFPKGVANALLFTLKLKITPYLKPSAREFPLPVSFADFIKKTPLTHGFIALYLALHMLRLSTPYFHNLYLTQGFSVSQFTWSGLFIGPLFHNHAYHLLGDLASFWFFGMLLELMMGSRLFFLITALGLWATNPLAWGTVESVTKFFPTLISADAYAQFLKEMDYGSSNAVYAVVGALAAIMMNPRMLLIPFIVNGLLICILNESLLAIHHLQALACGYFILLLRVGGSKPAADSRERVRF